MEVVATDELAVAVRGRGASLVVVLLWSVQVAGRRMDVMLSPGVPERPKWYYRPVWVLVLLFLVLGPFGLPYLWRSPRFSRRWKVVLTVLVITYMAVLADEAIGVYREVKREMDTLGMGIEF